jgi:uncharacterized protein (DUF1330 family)
VAKGYWVAFADVSDPEGYKAYIAENANAFRKYGGRFLTRGGPFEAPEGKPRSRTVVIEFPTYDAALECYGRRSMPRLWHFAGASRSWTLRLCRATKGRSRAIPDGSVALFIFE